MTTPPGPPTRPVLAPLTGALLACGLLAAAAAFAQPRAELDGPGEETSGPPRTQKMDLSGTGYGDEVPWEFKLDSRKGRRAGVWTEIPVPSQWQQEGFGSYEYGHDKWKANDVGHYRHRFEVPAEWRGRRLELVFDGVMTDAEVLIDGQSAGARHQGGFYRFRYDVTSLVEPGAESLLEVIVRQKSKSWTVEAAERDADYWVFGGIYRPVWLRALPAASVDHVAIDARHDGALDARVRLVGAPPGSSVEASVLGWPGEELVARLGTVAVRSPSRSSAETVEVAGTVPDVAPWSADSPSLYRLRLDLVHGGKVLHRHDERFGFRTIELRTEGEDRGLYVNERRTRLRGVNRHAFWPASGRTLNPRIDRRDAELIKGLHFNAVRAAHYPPDESFLAACDELGLYVIDELPGWHDAYGTQVGRRLVAEMVERDVNHPSILMWANGNEDGWNVKLDREFGRHDPQDRPVLHPRALLGPMLSVHYPSWQEWLAALDSADIRRTDLAEPQGELVIATEALHGLYDGGSGAGLEDFWSAMRASSRGIGLFLWAFTDEAIERTDLGRRLDTDGNHAPDGVLGPYREPSGNVEAIRHVFSPLRLLGHKQRPGGVELELENRFDHLDLRHVDLRWSLETHGGDVLAEGRRPLPATEPGDTVTLGLDLASHAPTGDSSSSDSSPSPSDLPPLPAAGEGGRGGEGPTAGVLRLVASHAGRSVFAHDLVLDWPRLPPRPALGDLRIEDAPAGLRLLAGTAETGLVGLEIDRALETVTLIAGDRRLRLGAPQPVLPGDCPFPPAGVPEIDTSVDSRGAVAEVRFGGGCLWRYRWTVRPSGRVRLDWDLRTAPAELAGVVLPTSPERALRFAWLGEGPSRQWGNRRHGRWGVYAKAKADDPGLRWAHEPKFRGYHRVAVGELDTEDGALLVAEDVAPGGRGELFFGLYSPRLPEDSLDALSELYTPDGLAWLHRIPPIGSKQNTPAALTPESPRRPYEAFEGRVIFSLVDTLTETAP